MNAQIMQTAMTRITTDLKNSLIRVIDVCRKVQYYGIVFDKPVDYVGLPLPDYLKIVKRPMDFSTLEKNLNSGGYEFLYEFLQDVELIWTNCRQYNADDTSFKEIIDYMEETMLVQLDKLEYKITPEVYKIINQSNIPKLKPESRIFSVTRLQCLMKELCDLPENEIAECIYVLLEQKNELNLIHGSDVVLRLNNCSYQQLETLETMILERKSKNITTCSSVKPDIQKPEPKRRGRKKKEIDFD